MQEDKLLEVIELVNRYYHQNNISINVKIHFVDNINTSWIKFTQNEAVIKQYQRGNFTNYNGLCMPYERGVYHILISNKYDDYKCTALHEATHAADYDRFRINFNGGDESIENNNCYWAMCLYSEFHARRVGHFYKLQTTPDLTIEKEAYELTNIYNEINDLLLQFKNGDNLDNKFDYELMQYLGRIYAYGFEDLSQLHSFDKNIILVYQSLVALVHEWSAFLFENLIDNLSLLHRSI